MPRVVQSYPGNPKKRQTKKEKREFEQALKDVPKLIMQEMSPKTELSHWPTTSTQKKEYMETRAPHKATRQKKIWLWVGVGTFAASILFMWGIQTMTLFYETRQQTDVAETFLEDGQNEFKNIINTFSDMEKQFGISPSSTDEITPDENQTTTSTITTTTKQTDVKQLLNSLFSTTSPRNEGDN